MTRKTRRVKGGANPLKSLGLGLLVALGLAPKPSQGLSLHEAYTWLNTRHTPEEINAVATKIVGTANQYKLPSFPDYTVSQVSELLTLVPGTMYSVTREPAETPEIRLNDQVRFVQISDEDPEMVQVTRVSDPENQRYDIPRRSLLGGKRRKTLRRRK